MVDFSTIPLYALTEQTIQIISTLLNPPKVIPTQQNYLRDWRGLASEVNISGERLPSLANSNDPTSFIITYMQGKNSVITDLQRVLEKLERWDILDDVAKYFENDAMRHLESKQNASTKALVNEQDSQILTTEDRIRTNLGQENMHYDAFLLFADEDYEFACKMVDYLETECQMKLCIKDRNLMPGLMTNDAIMELISNRCNRLIVVLSPEFLTSPENTFFLSYAQAVGIDKRQRKIIPCMYKRCELPNHLRYMFILDYNRAGFYDFWGKLRDSVQTVQTAQVEMIQMPKSKSTLAIADESKETKIRNQLLSMTAKKLGITAEKKDISLSLPSVSHLEDPGKSTDTLVQKKTKKPKYIKICKKKLTTLLLRQ